MSRTTSLPQFSATLKTTVRDISRFVRLDQIAPDQYEEAGFGGSANVFRGEYTKGDGQIVKVAVKCMRPKVTDENEDISREKIDRRVARELGIWDSLNEGRNIVQLLGIFTGIKSMPSLVCELCTGNLQEYLERKSPPPKHVKMLTDTLRGLSFMHGLTSGPVAHGDIKLHNILVTPDETAKLCDFGRSRKLGDPGFEPSHSSALAGTFRYMSPELFGSNVDGPTPAADMWAYGCVALEVMCRVAPYHEAANDLDVIKLITSGNPPGHRPSGPRASLVNDKLWSALATCWSEQDRRPTAQTFLDQLLSMLQNGDVSASPIFPELFPGPESGPIEQWSEEMPELSDHLEIEEGFGAIASSDKHYLDTSAALVRRFRSTPLTTVAIKVPRLNTKLLSRHDGLKQVLRKMVKGRFGVRHKNIIDLMGIDSSFEPHSGLVLEYCGLGNLVSYCKANHIIRDEYTRPQSPMVNAYSLMSDILDGLRYMHSYPIPIPQGDLTPENVLISADGIAKINLFSFGRALAALPHSLTLAAPTGPLLPFRWMSPELLSDNHQPTTESDIWAVGCICYWLLTELVPYSTHREDLAGIEIMHGQPPGTLANVYHGRSWVTNGIWRNISKCWSRDPLQRPSALELGNLLKQLEGKKFDWLPIEVEDLAGKVKDVGSEAPLVRHGTVWSESYPGTEVHETDIRVEMVMYQSTYVPNWYSRVTPIRVKAVEDERVRAQLASIRHEITIMSQLSHLHIVKLLGIDSSYHKGPAMILEFCSDTSLEKLLSQSQPNFRDGFKLIKCVTSAVRYLHEHENGTIAHGNIQPENIYVLPDGQAKLTNFTCAFQYILGQPTAGMPLSSTIFTPLLPSLFLEPQSYDEKPRDSLRLPTTAGDIWSLGSIILSMFTSTFQYQSPDTYSTRIHQGASPCDMHELSYQDPQVSGLIRSMFAYERSERPSARVVFDGLPEIETASTGGIGSYF